MQSVFRGLCFPQRFLQRWVGGACDPSRGNGIGLELSAVGDVHGNPSWGGMAALAFETLFLSQLP